MATKEAGNGNKGCKGGWPHAQTLTRDRQRKCNKEWWWLGTFLPCTFTNCNHLPNNKPSIRLQLHANCKMSSLHQHVVMTHKGPLFRLWSLEFLLSKGKSFWMNLFNNYQKYRSLWKLLCTKQGCTVFRVSGGEFSPLLSSCKVFVTLSPRYFLHRHIVEENLHFQWPVPGYLNMIKLFHALQYFFLQIFVVSDAGLYQSISEAAG